MVEGLVMYITGGKTVLQYHPEGKEPPKDEKGNVQKDKDGNPLPPKVYNLEFKRPWKRYDMIETLEEKLKVKFPPGDTLHDANANKFLRELCTKVRVL
jgi:lysyl-tRNA synthetase class 2